MKKLLALILSVILILSVMPVAFAAEKTQYEVYVEEYIRLVAYADNVYDSSSFNEYIISTYRDELWLNDLEPDSENLLNAIERIKKANADIEKRIANGEAIVVYDFYAIIEADYALRYYCDGLNEFEEYFYNNNYDYYQEVRQWIDEMSMVIKNGGTQAEFEAAAQKIIDFYKQVRMHLDGDHTPEKYVDNCDGTHKIKCTFCGKNEISAHTFSEYVSNNDATEEADGTKTATCELCGATDTVVDEGSKLVKEPASFIEMLIALIKSFFEKILSIFG